MIYVFCNNSVDDLNNERNLELRHTQKVKKYINKPIETNIYVLGNQAGSFFSLSFFTMEYVYRINI
jgi:hypothetical protein